MYSRLLDVSATLASTPPPAELWNGSASGTPIVPAPCHSCAAAAAPVAKRMVEHYVDAPSTADNLLFADDEFVTGDNAAPAAPYANPLSAPGATAFSAGNVLAAAAATGGATPPGNFKEAVGAQTLGSQTTVTFATSAPAPPVQAYSTTATTSWMPAGLTNLQALILAVAVCTGCLLLFFIVGMNSAQPAAAQPGIDPLLGI